ncbi:MAG: recombination regulator RecX, partial [Burkholderiaceae bacterium]
MRAKADPEAAPAAPPSAGTLRARALRYLATREHTRHELHTKLARFCPD